MPKMRLFTTTFNSRHYTDLSGGQSSTKNLSVNYFKRTASTTLKVAILNVAHHGIPFFFVIVVSSSSSLSHDDDDDRLTFLILEEPISPLRLSVYYSE